MHMTQAFRPQAALERCAVSIARLLALLPPALHQRIQILPRSPSQVAFLLHGLEFARARQGFSANSFIREEQLTFGAGANETPLDESSEALFTDLVSRLASSRQPHGHMSDPLYRLQPERWMESALRSSLAEILPGIQQQFVYSQVPAFAAGDRGMLDLLSVDRNGRLVVIELKADEDLHLPLQGLDYWLRVRWLNLQGRDREGTGDFERNGYFQADPPRPMLSTIPPLLCFIAPALRIHPANEIVLHYLAPEIEWTFIALGEQWREQRTVVFRKHSAAQ